MHLWKIEKQRVYVKIYVIYENIKSEIVVTMELMGEIHFYTVSIAPIMSIKIWNRTKQANSNNNNNV